MYLRHKSIQVMKEEQRREKEQMKAKQNSVINSIEMERERTLGRYLQFQRHSLSPMRTFNPSYGGGASGIQSGVSITAPPYRQPVFKEGKRQRKKTLHELYQMNNTTALHTPIATRRPQNSRQFNR